jgi:hypothetical protein
MFLFFIVEAYQSQAKRENRKLMMRYGEGAIQLGQLSIIIKNDQIDNDRLLLRLRRNLPLCYGSTTLAARRRAVARLMCAQQGGFL